MTCRSNYAQQLTSQVRRLDLRAGRIPRRNHLEGRRCRADAGSLRICQEGLGFDYLVDITQRGQLRRDPRLTIVYHLYGYGHHCHLRLKTDVSEEKAELPTVTGVWRTADWHEREIYDMMGIRFRGHPDLRRILMWEGYPYFPLRKDFPLAGKPTRRARGRFHQARAAGRRAVRHHCRRQGRIAREPRVRVPETDAAGNQARLERRQIKEATAIRTAGPLNRSTDMAEARDIEFKDARASRGSATRGRRQARSRAT